MINFFSKRKNEININEMDVSEKKTEHILEESKTLGDLAKSGHLFFRFSQSKPGRSVENVYGKVLIHMYQKQLLEDTGDNIRLTEKGIDVSNYVMSEFLF